MSIDASDLYRLEYHGKRRIDPKTFETYIQKNVPGYDITIPRTWPFIKRQELLAAFGKYDGTQLLPRFAAYEVSVMQSFVEKNSQVAPYIFYPFNVMEVGNRLRKVVQMPKEQQDRFCALAHFWSHYATLNSTDAGSDAVFTVMKCESQRWKILELERDMTHWRKKVSTLEFEVKKCETEIAQKREKGDIDRSWSWRATRTLKATKASLTGANQNLKTTEALLKNAKDELKSAKTSMETMRKRLSTADTNKLGDDRSQLKLLNGVVDLTAEDNEREKILKTDAEFFQTQLSLAREHIKLMEVQHRTKTECASNADKKHADLMEARLNSATTELSQVNERMETIRAEAEFTKAELMKANERAAEATNSVSEGLLADLARMKQRAETAELRFNKWRKRARDYKKEQEDWQAVAERSFHAKYERKLQKQARKEKKQLRKQKKRAQDPNVHEPLQTDNARIAPEVAE
ncbi:hypothetical protein IQ07DRAFT_642060 [Pyrenochaeta sp. DS3sAY3a]|nr:hypothetical protein IQ07DRAFT_642060 [Pyrenochaeta sp. DS3sAY3a]